MFHLFKYIAKDMRVYPEHMKRDLGVTKGLIFSQRVMLALVDKGLSRQAAYSMVQRNAMKSWKEELNFFDLISKDSEVTKHLSKKELEGIFDYKYFIRHVDEIFARLKLG